MQWLGRCPLNAHYLCHQYKPRERRAADRPTEWISGETKRAPMMEWWVLQEIKNSDEEKLKCREKIFLNLMSREQAEQLKKVTQQIWQNRNALENLIPLIRKLLGS